MRVRLTDQAAVAVRLARLHAQGRDPTVVDLLVALTSEPDGAAGRLLRAHPAAAQALVERGAASAAAGAPLDIAVRWAAQDAAGRAIGTAELLTAALEAGGTHVAELLAACGAPDDLTRRASEAGGAAAAETLGLTADPGAAGLTPDAAAAVARTRAVDGRTVALLIAAARTAEGAAAALPDADMMETIAAQLAPELDKGDLEHVVSAARTWAAGRAVTCADLVRAAMIVGGDGPRILMERAVRHDASPPEGP